jgi:hypothetical protein
MSEHRPTAYLQCDVFTDRFREDEEVTPQRVAEAAWSDVQDWVHNGYQPVIEVVMEDGTHHTVDLEPLS